MAVKSPINLLSQLFRLVRKERREIEVVQQLNLLYDHVPLPIAESIHKLRRS